jgi:hypothetical protein
MRADVAPVPLVVDVPRAAEMLAACESDVRAWIASGRLPCVRYPSNRRPNETSRRVLVAVADLRAFVVASRDAAPSPNAALSDAAVRRWAKPQNGGRDADC